MSDAHPAAADNRSLPGEAQATRLDDDNYVSLFENEDGRVLYAKAMPDGPGWRPVLVSPVCAPPMGDQCES